MTSCVYTLIVHVSLLGLKAKGLSGASTRSTMENEIYLFDAI